MERTACFSAPMGAIGKTQDSAKTARAAMNGAAKKKNGQRRMAETTSS
jgi:hypothetical protein